MSVKRKTVQQYITAKQLAAELLKFPNAIICSTTDNFEQGNNTVPMKYLSIKPFDAVVRKESFRDAFDGGGYSSDVVRTIFKDTDLREGEKKRKFIKL